MKSVWPAVALGLVVSLAASRPVVAGDDAKVRRRDLTALLEHLGDECKLLDEKNIKWRRVAAKARTRLKEVDSDADFYGLLVWVVGRLHDSHAGVYASDARVSAAWDAQRPKRWQIPMALMPGAHGLVLVSWVDDGLKTRGIEPGMVLHSIDGDDAADWLENRAKARFEEGYYSTMHRARMQTYATGVDLPQARKTRLVLRRLALTREDMDRYRRKSSGARAGLLRRARSWKTLEVDVQAEDFREARYLGRGFEAWRVPGLAKAGAITQYAVLPSGLGYVNLRKIRGDQPADLATVFEALADCPGLVVDMRWNGGGGDEKEVAACFPGHGRPEPGTWTKPVAVLIGPRVMSSGDSVAYFLRSWYRHELFGSNTTGASGPKKTFELPSGFATVRFVFQHWKSRRLEGVGVPPTRPVLQDVVDLSLGIDSVRAAAERYLLRVAK